MRLRANAISIDFCLEDHFPRMHPPRRRLLARRRPLQQQVGGAPSPRAKGGASVPQAALYMHAQRSRTEPKRFRLKKRKSSLPPRVRADVERSWNERCEKMTTLDFIPQPRDVSASTHLWSGTLVYVTTGLSSLCGSPPLHAVTALRERCSPVGREGANGRNPRCLSSVPSRRRIFRAAEAMRLHRYFSVR